MSNAHHAPAGATRWRNLSARAHPGGVVTREQVVHAARVRRRCVRGRWRRPCRPRSRRRQLTEVLPVPRAARIVRGQGAARGAAARRAERPLVPAAAGKAHLGRLSLGQLPHHVEDTHVRVAPGGPHPVGKDDVAVPGGAHLHRRGHRRGRAPGWSATGGGRISRRSTPRRPPPLRRWTAAPPPSRCGRGGCAHRTLTCPRVSHGVVTRGEPNC